MDCGDSYFRVGDLVMLIPANTSTSFKAGTSFNVCAFPYALNIWTGSASACTKHCTKKALCNSVTLRFAYMHIMGITIHQGTYDDHNQNLHNFYIKRIQYEFIFLVMDTTAHVQWLN